MYEIHIPAHLKSGTRSKRHHRYHGSGAQHTVPTSQLRLIFSPNSINSLELYPQPRYPYTPRPLHFLHFPALPFSPLILPRVFLCPMSRFTHLLTKTSPPSSIHLPNSSPESSAVARPPRLWASAGAGGAAHLGNGRVFLLPFLPGLRQQVRPGQLLSTRPEPVFCQRIGWLLWKERGI